MSEISSYVNYLPPVLWFREPDSIPFLGKMLRIFEKVLTGIPINARAVRANASFADAVGNRIVLNDLADAGKFRPEDLVNIEGTTERAVIEQILGAEILLVTALASSHAGGIVRIADLEPGQTRFRLDRTANIGFNVTVEIARAETSEIAIVEQIQDDFILLRNGLVNTYPMSDTDVPVKIRDGQPIIGRRSASFADASGERIILNNLADAGKFRSGDSVTIEGTTERAAIARVVGREIILVEPLSGTHSAGIVRGDRQYTDLETTIANLDRLFDPWRTPSNYLPWLASWVALSLRQDWSEYQRRKLISEIVPVYQQRGLKRGLQTYLDIYAATQARPRIAIDDGEAIFRTTFAENGMARLHAVAYSRRVLLSGSPISILLHPTGLGVDANNNYIVIDEGNVALTPPQPPALWRISSMGEVEYVPDTPLSRPSPIYSGNPLQNPRAVVVDSQNRYSVLEIGTVAFNQAAIYRFSPPSYAISTVISTPSTPAFAAVHPVDMILDNAENFVVLDRGFPILGDPPGGSLSNNPKILVVDSNGTFLAPEHLLNLVVEPTAIAVDAMGRFIVADAKDQYSADPVELVRVDPADGWSETPLIDGANPLVFPAGLVFESSNTLLVCDTGLRWGYNTTDPEGSDPAYRYLAEPAAIYRVDLSQTPPAISRITSERELVNPAKMTFDLRGKLIVADRGESLRSSPQRDWRSRTNEFGVVVHFSRERPTNFNIRNQIRRGIVDVVDAQKPSQSAWWIDF